MLPGGLKFPISINLFLLKFQFKSQNSPNPNWNSPSLAWIPWIWGKISIPGNTGFHCNNCLKVMCTLIFFYFVLYFSFFNYYYFYITGWYIVWKCFLSKFKFIRELLGKQQEANSSTEESKQTRSRSARKVRREWLSHYVQGASIFLSSFLS